MLNKEKQFCSEYLKQRIALYENALSGVHGALERTKESLLWRGFLVMEINNRLYLSSGSPSEDIDMLRFFEINFQMPGDDCQTRYLDLINARIDNELPGDGTIPAISTHDIPPFKDVLAEIEPTEDENVLYSLFIAPPVNRGFCGPFEFSGWTDTDWRSFKSLRFGRKVPVEVLEAGVALLVKTLPLLGLDTVMSCEGHAQGEVKAGRSQYTKNGDTYCEPSDNDDAVPTIYFMSKYHLKWAKRVLPHFLPPGDPFVEQWTFEEGTAWNGCKWRLAPKGSINTLDSKFAVLKNIRRLCGSILDSHWNAEGCYDPENSLARKLRDYKRELTSPRDLESPGLGDRIARLCR